MILKILDDSMVLGKKKKLELLLQLYAAET